MYNIDQIKDFLFLDIETVSEYENYGTLVATNPSKAKLWDHRCEYLKRRYRELETLSESEIYTQKAALHAEFSKIICVAIGVYNPGAGAQIRVYRDQDERTLLANLFHGLHNYFRSSGAKGRLVGHNIKRFDVPHLCKRALSYYGIHIPFPLIDVAILKPWESPLIDTSEMWGYGAWQETFTGLELIANHLDIPTSKDVMHADEVGHMYWVEKDMDKISKYCSYDVRDTMNVFFRICCIEEMITDEKIQYI